MSRLVELCCGFAAVSLCLLGGRGCVPPPPWLGGKRRFAPAILATWGLVPGQGPDWNYLWVDSGPPGDVWPVLLDPILSAAVAQVLRSWSGRDPRELWEDLAGRPPAAELPERTAQWLWLQARSINAIPVFWSNERWAMGAGPNQGDNSSEQRAQQTGLRQRGADGPATGRGLQFPETMADRVEGGAWLSPPSRTDRSPEPIRQKGTTGGRGAGVTDPAQLAARVENVAAWLVLQAGNARGHSVEAVDGEWKTRGFAHISNSAREKGFSARFNTGTLADRIESGAWLRGASGGREPQLLGPGYQARDGSMTSTNTMAERVEQVERGQISVLKEDVRAVEPPRGGDGDYCYFDPNYVGRTGYGRSVPRNDVLLVAKRWGDAGWAVSVSEQEPLPLPGWHHADITRTATGKVYGEEWLTMNRPPHDISAHIRPQQVELTF